MRSELDPFEKKQLNKEKSDLRKKPKLKHSKDLWKQKINMKHGDVVIAAITSCTNTSNPSVMLGAGLVAKKAVEKGLQVKPYVKTSLAPGSRVVTDYLDKAGLTEVQLRCCQYPPQ